MHYPFEQALEILELCIDHSICEESIATLYYEFTQNNQTPDMSSPAYQAHLKEFYRLDEISNTIHAQACTTIYPSPQISDHPNLMLLQTDLCLGEAYESVRAAFFMIATPEQSDAFEKLIEDELNRQKVAKALAVVRNFARGKNVETQISLLIDPDYAQIFADMLNDPLLGNDLTALYQQVGYTLSENMHD